MIEDDEEEIIEAVRRMSDRYDLVVTRYFKIRYTSMYTDFQLSLVTNRRAAAESGQRKYPGTDIA